MNTKFRRALAADAGQHPRRTQAERSATTRVLLLDATIDSLIEVGYANTTTTAIAERAGLSRGAQMHHYPAKADMVADAVERLADKRLEQMRGEVARLRGSGDRVKRALDLLWGAHKDPLFTATLELWMAARTDADLRAHLAPVERRVRVSVYETARQLFGEEAVGGRRFERVLSLSLTLMQGLALLATHEKIDSPDLDGVWARYRDELARLFNPVS